MAGTSCRATLGSIPHAWPWNCRNNVPGCLVLVCKVDESGDLREMYSALAWNDTWDDARTRTLLFYLRGARSLRIPASWRPLIGDLSVTDWPGDERVAMSFFGLHVLFLLFGYVDPVQKAGFTRPKAGFPRPSRTRPEQKPSFYTAPPFFEVRPRPCPHAFEGDLQIHAAQQKHVSSATLACCPR